MEKLPGKVTKMMAVATRYWLLVVTLAYLKTSQFPTTTLCNCKQFNGRPIILRVKLLSCNIQTSIILVALHSPADDETLEMHD